MKKETIIRRLEKVFVTHIFDKIGTCDNAKKKTPAKEYKNATQSKCKWKKWIGTSLKENTTGRWNCEKMLNLIRNKGIRAMQIKTPII